MGIVTAEVVLVGAQPGADGTVPTEMVRALVDTGATLSVFPAPTLERLGVRRIATVPIRVGDGRRIERSVGNLETLVEGQAVWTRAVFGEPGDPIVLGVTVLEQLGLMVDPVARRLVPAEFLLLSAG